MKHPTLSRIGGILIGIGTALFLLVLLVAITVSIFQEFGSLVGIVTAVVSTFLFSGAVMIMIASARMDS